MRAIRQGSIEFVKATMAGIAKARTFVRAFVFVLILVFVTRYMGPEGPWQRLCRCPSQGSSGIF